MRLPASEFWQILLDAPKRSLVRYSHPRPSSALPTAVLKSTVVKLTNGNGPCLELKRNGEPMKKAHASLKGWVDSLHLDAPPANGALSIQFPPSAKKAHPMA